MNTSFQNCLKLVIYAASAYELFFRLYGYRTLYNPLLMLLVASIAGLIFSFFRRSSKIATYLLVIIQFVILVYDFPLSANHQYLFFASSLLIFCLRDDSFDESRVFIQLQSIIPVIAIFWSGVQKCVHGYYTEGIFFSYSIAHSPRFARIFTFILGDETVKDIQQLVLSTGVYRVENSLLILVSQTVVALELLIPLLFLYPRIRNKIVIVMIGFVASIQLGAQEYPFCMYMVSSLLLSFSIKRQCQFALFCSLASASIISGYLLLSLF